VTEAAAPVVELAQVSKTYRNGTIALAPVDLAIARGEFVSLLGPSGCGKTTLVNLIAGLAKPSTGSIRRFGADVRDSDAGSGQIAYVFQSPTLMPWARVDANVRLPLDLAHVDRAAADRAVRRALELVGLDRFGRDFPRELSGGMQMRVSLARALVTSPALLLMDEPFGALDEFTRQRLDDELLSLWRAQRMTIVFVTHSIVEAVYLSSRIVVLGPRPGRIVATFDVDAGLPRGDAWRTSPAFGDLQRRISAAVSAAGLEIAHAGR
jgi:NitT/TauT family transport system ATP-binding protein